MYYYGIKNSESEEYTNKTLPLMNDIVFVEITKFSGNNTYCKLLEYNNIEGFVPATELDKYVVDPTKQFKFNTTYPMVVMGIRISESGETSVDLSYKKIQKDLRSDLLLKFININKLFSILKEFCFVTGVSHDVAQKLILFPKFEMNSQQYLTDADLLYKQYLRSPDEFFSGIEFATDFITNMKNRLDVTQMLVYQYFNLTVEQSGSLDILRQILCGYKSECCKIEYLSSPKYQLTINCDNEEKRQENLNIFLTYMSEQQKLYKIKFELDESVIIKTQDFILHPLNMNVV